MYALHNTTSLGSVGLKTIKLQRHPSIPLLIIGSREAHTLTGNLPLWEGGNTELTQRLLLNKTLWVEWTAREQQAADSNLTWNTYVVLRILAAIVERILEYELWARYESEKKNISSRGV